MQGQPGDNAPQGQISNADRLVYVVPESQFDAGAARGTDIELIDLWRALWRRRWYVSGVTVAFACVGLLYALLATEWWRAEVVLAPVEDRGIPAIAGQLGGLAALAGVNLGTGGVSGDALAIVRSRDFAADFINDKDLLPVLFAEEWDSAAKAWRSDDPRKHRDVRDGVRKFHEDVLRVTQDRQTKFVTLSVEWTDPEVAAQWARESVDRVNTRMRDRARQRAEANLAYLESELAKTSIVTLQRSIGRIMESEMQSLMLARGNEEFAFRILDAPSVPKFRARPRRAFSVVLSVLVGLVFAVSSVLIVQLSSGSLDRRQPD